MSAATLDKLQTLEVLRHLVLEGCLSGVHLQRGELTLTFKFADANHNWVVRQLFGDANFPLLRAEAMPAQVEVAE